MAAASNSCTNTQRQGDSWLDADRKIAEKLSTLATLVLQKSVHSDFGDFSLRFFCGREQYVWQKRDAKHLSLACFNTDVLMKSQLYMKPVDHVKHPRFFPFYSDVAVNDPNGPSTSMRLLTICTGLSPEGQRLMDIIRKIFDHAKFGMSFPNLVKNKGSIDVGVETCTISARYIKKCDDPEALFVEQELAGSEEAIQQWEHEIKSILPESFDVKIEKFFSAQKAMRHKFLGYKIHLTTEPPKAKNEPPNHAIAQRPKCIELHKYHPISRGIRIPKDSHPNNPAKKPRKLNISFGTKMPPVKDWDMFKQTTK